MVSVCTGAVVSGPNLVLASVRDINGVLRLEPDASRKFVLLHDSQIGVLSFALKVQTFLKSIEQPAFFVKPIKTRGPYASKLSTMKVWSILMMAPDLGALPLSLVSRRQTNNHPLPALPPTDCSIDAADQKLQAEAIRAAAFAMPMADLIVEEIFGSGRDRDHDRDHDRSRSGAVEAGCGMAYIL